MQGPRPSQTVQGCGDHDPQEVTLCGHVCGSLPDTLLILTFLQGTGIF